MKNQWPGVFYHVSKSQSGSRPAEEPEDLLCTNISLFTKYILRKFYWKNSPLPIFKLNFIRVKWKNLLQSIFYKMTPFYIKEFYMQNVVFPSKHCSILQMEPFTSKNFSYIKNSSIYIKKYSHIVNDSIYTFLKW